MAGPKATALSHRRADVPRAGPRAHGGRYLSAGRPEDSLATLHACLRLYEASDANLAEANGAAVKFIAQAIAAPKAARRRPCRSSEA